jgi:hypothetical protein
MTCLLVVCINCDIACVQHEACIRQQDLVLKGSLCGGDGWAFLFLFLHNGGGHLLKALVAAESRLERRYARYEAAKVATSLVCMAG